MSPPTCATCESFLASERGSGICRRYPPSSDATRRLTLVSSKEWCREWSPIRTEGDAPRRQSLPLLEDIGT
jgi:hypothetical protein